MKKKTPNLNIINGTQTNPVRDAVTEEYLEPDLFTGSRTPYLEDRCKIILQEGIEYVTNTSDCINVMEYVFSKRITEATWNKWRNRWPWFHEGAARMRRIIGMRREKGMIYKGMDREVVKYMQHMYDPEYDEANKYWAALKNQESNKSGFYLVEIPPTEDTGRVKPNVRRSVSNEQDKLEAK